MTYTAPVVQDGMPVPDDTFNEAFETIEDHDDQLTAIAGYGRGILVRGHRATASTTTTSTVGVLRIDDRAITAGRLLHVSSGSLHLDSSVANDVVEAEIRYTTDGSTPTTASTVLPGARTYARQQDAAWPETRTISATYTPASNETLSLLLCVVRKAGSGNVSIFADADHLIEMLVEDLGTDPGDTGVDI